MSSFAIVYIIYYKLDMMMRLLIAGIMDFLGMLLTFIHNILELFR
ncbi:hypothetical protein PMAL9190_03279 [Photobacterium malacitanum]|uniref:Uncharacterized protein n=1 Tax=Photobacterium malacitanum TaxID=2204294 RepID=A0A1Y6MQ15_9GAMM|nr:hypothetical protein [Photobacterium malacitanum]SMY37959.1 hypothetical protein PMAL9190_03279 [Photobacterium malacitanum]